MSANPAVDLACKNISSTNPNEVIGTRRCSALNTGSKGTSCRQKVLSADSDFCQAHAFELQTLTATYQGKEREADGLEWTPEITKHPQQMLILIEAKMSIMRLRNQARTQFPPLGEDSTVHAQCILALQGDVKQLQEYMRV